MKYNPRIHHRRSIRLKGYDYSQAGAYFITVCCQDKKCRFGKIENDEMVLNEFGTVAFYEWMKLAERFPNFELDVYQIMPNHIHGIIVLVGAGLAPAPLSIWAGVNPVPTSFWAGASPAPTPVGDIVGAYKSLVANECLKIFKSNNDGIIPVPMMGKLWQRNYYEHIIKNEQSYQTISNYIITNLQVGKKINFIRNKFLNESGVWQLPFLHILIEKVKVHSNTDSNK